MDPVPTLKIQIASKEEWLQWYRVFLYSSADLSLRDIAGVCAGSGRHISDEAVRQRVGACPKWVEVLLGQRLPASQLPPCAEGRGQSVICEGSPISGPGAKGTDYRWHIAYNPGAHQACELHLSEAHTSESLTLDPLRCGSMISNIRLGVGSERPGYHSKTAKTCLGHWSGRITTHYSAAELHNLIEAANRVCGQDSRKSPALVLLKQKSGLGQCL